MLFKNHDELVRNGATPVLQQKRKDVLEMLTAALESVQPSTVIASIVKDSHLRFQSETIDLTTFDHVYLVGFGKASVGMAQTFCKQVKVTKGVVITNDPHARITYPSLETVVGGHPLPNEGSIQGAKKILTLLRQCQEHDCVIVLISGGGSSLFCKPRVPLPDLQHTIDLLIRSGATIQEINTIRKHLSFIKGGQLAQQTKAVIFSLIISDIVHDPMSFIASGPTVPDPTTYADAMRLLQRYHLWDQSSEAVRSVIEQGVKGQLPETLKENDPSFIKVFNYIVANNERACQVAVQKALELGYDAKLITTSITGEAKTLGRYLVNQAKNSVLQKHAAFISGGEPTVTVQGNGTGGRNQELVLGCVESLANSEMVLASFATDGRDGNSPAAGAIADGYSNARAQKKHLNPLEYLKNNNSSTFFENLGDSFHTGFTGTNVMDIQIILQ
jgi:glycerate 2-kinase